MSNNSVSAAILLGISLLMLGIGLTSQRVMLSGVNRDRDQTPGLFWIAIACWVWIIAVAAYVLIARS